MRDWGTHLAEPRPGPNRRHLCRYDGETLVVALRLYQAEKGKPATSLDALVPDYLPAIPNDPFSGKPFRYRLSKGEEIEWPDDLKEPEGEAGMGGFGGAAAPGEMGAPGGGPPPGMGMVGGAPQPGMLGAAPPAGMLGGAPPGAAAPPGMGGIDAAHAPVVVKLPTRKVSAGQGIVWSVGEDGEDNGGKRQTRQRGHPQPGEDMIFLAPLPKVKK